MDAEKLRNLADRAATRALKKSKTFENDLEDDSPMELEEGEEVDIEALTEFDIFDHCENEFIRKGDFIEYTIKRNGSTVGFKKHPYSWQKTQKEFGGGRYKIIAKSTTTGKIVKNQTQALEDVAEERGNNQNQNGFDPAMLFDKIAEAVKPKNESLGLTELMGLMDKAADRARTEAQNQGNSMLAMMQENTKMLMMLMQQPKPDNTKDMYQMIQAFAEKMENRFEKVIDKITAKEAPKNDVGILEMLKMKEDAEERGFKKYAQLNQLAEVKAQEKVDLIEEYRGEGGEKKDKSMTETLIETMLPTIAGALAKTQAPQPAPQQRRVVSPRPNQQRTANPTAPTLPKANFKPQAKPIQKNGESVGKASGQNIKPTSQVNTGLPKANFNVQKQSPIVLKSVPNEAWKKRATDLLIPVFTEHLINQTDPHLVSPQIVETLNQNGIGREEFLSKVGISDILNIVKGFDLPEIAYPWFEEVYANIKNSGTANAVGEHSADGRN